VTINNLEILDWQPPLVTVEVACGPGTYIRSLAHDLGRALDCGAYLKSLTRCWCGPFRIEDAVTLARFEEAVEAGNWHDLVNPVDTVLTGWAPVSVDAGIEAGLVNGRPVILEEALVPEQARLEARCRAYGLDGSFLGLLRLERDTGEWYPYKIFV
jgi:tRNA pseudouridine55 synthase